MQLLLLSDELGNVIGEATVEECHTGNGKRHLAFVVAIFNNKNEVLIQKRAKDKRFPFYWEFPASHLFKNESWEEAMTMSGNYTFVLIPFSNPELSIPYNPGLTEVVTAS